jgi:tetratricopeptide (TPR) repeat protein
MRSTMAAAGMSFVPVGILLVLSGTARAQTPLPANDKVAAEALFEDGRKLIAEGKYAEACPKFAESERLDSSPSTLLNLANCWEKLGRTATAWATYRQAESVASAAKRQDYTATAQRHATALASKLARLTINVQQPIAGMQLKRDGTVIALAEWGAAIPIDSGLHSVDASAAGYREWSTRVDVAQDGAQIVITVPPLEALPADAPQPASPTTNQPASAPLAAPPPVQAEHTSTGSVQRTVGVVVAAAGVVGLGISGAYAVAANNKKQGTLKDCPNNVCQSPAALSQRNDALWAGDAASVAFGIGAAALVAGVVVWITAPSSSHGGSTAGLAVAPTVGGALVQGTW